MSKTIKEIEVQLDAKIPREVVAERDGGGGRRLSYLEGFYVIDRLNKVFGHLNWSKEIVEIKEVVNKTGKGEFPAYLAKVKLTVAIVDQENGIHRLVTKEGYGYGCDKSTQNAHELAIKEAVTDGLKVAAKDLGMSMGLALYDKTQENVDDGIPEEAPKPTVSSAPSPIKPKSAPKEEPVGGKDKEGDTAALEEAIRGYVRVADKQKRLSAADFKSRLTEQHKVGKLAELTAAQMQSELSFLQNLTK